MAEATENKTIAKPPAKRGRPATKAAPKSVQQAHEEKPAPQKPEAVTKESGVKPNITAAKCTLPKVEGYQWTLESNTRILYLHKPGNQYKGYNRPLQAADKSGSVREALAYAAECLVEEKAFAEELFSLDRKITAVEELTV